MFYVGATNCHACVFTPEIKLLPCHHGICKHHGAFVKAGIEGMQGVNCGFCRQPIYSHITLVSSTVRPLPVPAKPLPVPAQPFRGAPKPVSSKYGIFPSNMAYQQTGFGHPEPQTPLMARKVTFEPPSNGRSLSGPSLRDAGMMKKLYDINTLSSLQHQAGFSRGGPRQSRGVLSPVDSLTDMMELHRLSDPFSDYPSASGVAIHGQTSTMASASGPFYSGSSPPTMSSISLAHHAQSPQALAKMIMSGALESPDESSNHTHHSPLGGNGRLSDATLHHPKIISNWSNHMIETVANPPFFQNAKDGKPPFLEVAMEYAPFTEPALLFEPSQAHVLVVKNLPYGATKNEIIASIGRTTRLVSQPPGTSYYAIHIIMERSTGKTMDAFVEIQDDASVQTILSSYRKRVEGRRGPRIGDRHVDIMRSSQTELMKTLFPRAKCVEWDMQVPTVHRPKEVFDSGFLGFLNTEEMNMMAKHAEMPQRSPFAQRCLNRTYECMISTLYKYPWFAIDYVLVKERDMLFDIACSMLRFLARHLRDARPHPRDGLPQLTVELLQELLCAALTVPFSQHQKLQIVNIMEQLGFRSLVGSAGYQSLGPLSAHWPFRILDMKPGVSMEVLDYYTYLLRTANPQGSAELLTGHDGSRSLSLTRNPFGSLHINYGPRHMSTITLRDAAIAEWTSIEAALRKVLPSIEEFRGLKNTPPRARMVSSDASSSNVVHAGNTMTTVKRLPAPAPVVPAPSAKVIAPPKPVAATKTSVPAVELVRRHNEAQAGAGAVSSTSSMNTNVDEPFVFHGLGAGFTNGSGYAQAQAPYGNKGKGKDMSSATQQQTFLDPTATNFRGLRQPEIPQMQLNPGASNFAGNPVNVFTRTGAWINPAMGGHMMPPRKYK